MVTLKDPRPMEFLDTYAGDEPGSVRFVLGADHARIEFVLSADSVRSLVGEAISFHLDDPAVGPLMMQTIQEQIDFAAFLSHAKPAGMVQ